MRRCKSIFTEKIKSTSFNSQEDLINFCENSWFNLEFGSLLLEAVINIEPEKNEVKNILIKNRDDIFKQKDFNQIQFLLNNIFSNRKLVFMFIDSNKEFVVLSGAYNANTNVITFFININLFNDKNFNDFIKQFIILFGHEFIHRVQFLKIKYKDVREKIFKIKAKKSSDVSNNPNNANTARKYLSDSHELMSYAWQIVNNFRANGVIDSSIKQILQSNTQQEAELGGDSLKDYLELFNSTKYSPILKQLYKYMYQYLEKA